MCSFSRVVFIIMYSCVRYLCIYVRAYVSSYVLCIYVVYLRRVFQWCTNVLCVVCRHVYLFHALVLHVCDLLILNFIYIFTSAV